MAEGARGRPVRAAIAAATAVGGVVLLAGAAAADLEPTGRDADDVRRTAEDVLAREEFQPSEPTVLDRVLDWIGEQLGRLVAQVFGAGSGGSGVLSLLLLGMVGVALFLLVRNLWGTSLRTAPTAEPEPWLALDEVRRPADWDAAAAAAEAAGDRRESLRCRFAALTVRLADAGVVPPEPGRTTGEHRRDVAAARPSAAAPFDEAADLFDGAWYGGRDVALADLAHFDAAAARTLAAAPSAPDGERPRPLEVPA